jgi:hypothetical protein
MKYPYLFRQMIRIELESLEQSAALLRLVHSEKMSPTPSALAFRVETGAQAFDDLLFDNGSDDDLFDELVRLTAVGQELKKISPGEQEWLSCLADNILVSVRVIEKCMAELWEARKA